MAKRRIHNGRARLGTRVARRLRRLGGEWSVTTERGAITMQCARAGGAGHHDEEDPITRAVGGVGIEVKPKRLQTTAGRVRIVAVGPSPGLGLPLSG